jgi:hypothetical protein
MLGKLFGNKAASTPPPKPGPQLGMLALKSGKGLNPPAISAAWTKLFPKESPLVEKGATKKDGQAVAEFACDDMTLMLAAMAMPIPQGDIDYACKLSWMWPTAAEELKAQRAHAIALTTPSGDPIREALSLSKLLAAAATAGDPAGVYWGNGGMVHKPEVFASALQSFDGNDSMLPVMMWIGVLISGDGPQGPFTLTTRGLNPFGHKELEILNTRMGFGDLRMLAYDICNYLLSSGPVLKHNDTFGRTATEKMRVEHTTSKFRKGEPVIRLHLP